MKEAIQQKKKIAIIGTVGVPANYGGFETLAEHLIDDLAAQHKISVYCSGKSYPKSKRKKHLQRGQTPLSSFRSQWSTEYSV